MSRSRFLIKNTLLISGAKIIVQACSFLLIPVYTRLLTPADFGLIELVLTYSSLLAPALLLQIDAAAFRLLIPVRGHSSRTTELLSSIWAVATAGILLAAAVSLLVGATMEDLSVVLAGSVFASAMILSLTQQTARGLGFLGAYVFSSVISGIAIVIGNLLALLVLNLGADGVLASTAIGYLLGGIVAFIGAKSWRHLRPRLVSREIVRSSLQYSLPLIPNGVAWWAIDAGGRAILAAFQGLSAIGTFGLASRITQVFSQAFSYFNLAWVESASISITDRDRERYFSSVFNQTLRLACGAVLMMLATLPAYFPILASNQFSAAQAIIPLLLLSSLLNAWVTLYSSVYIALQRTRAVLLTTLLAGIIAVALGLITVQKFGAFGIAASSIIAWSAALIHRHLSLRQTLKIRYSATTLISFCTSAVAVVGATFLKAQGLSWNPLHWGLFALLFTVGVNYPLLSKTLLKLKAK